jgi:hypothetical protein
MKLLSPAGVFTGWTTRARQTRDNGKRTRIVNGSTLKRLLRKGDEPGQAFAEATTVTIYEWYPGQTLYAVALVSTPAGTEAWFGSAGGYGYDKQAAALNGCPLGDVKRPWLTLTNHAGWFPDGTRPEARFGKGHPCDYAVLLRRPPLPFFVV